jgi:hypothetical protein
MIQTPNVTDDAWKHFRHWPRLCSIDLESTCDITDRGLDTLLSFESVANGCFEFPPLQHFTTKLSATAFDRLCSLEQIKRCTDFVRVTVRMADDNFAKLKSLRHLNQLMRVSVSLDAAAGVALERIGQYAPALTRLHIGGHDLRDKHLQHLSKLRLETLWVSSSPSFSGDGLRHLSGSAGTLRELVMFSCPAFCDDALALIAAQFTAFERLHVFRAPLITGDGVERMFAAMPSERVMKEIRLDDCDVEVSDSLRQLLSSRVARFKLGPRCVSSVGASPSQNFVVLLVVGFVRQAVAMVIAALRALGLF